MTEPSEAAKRRACEVLARPYNLSIHHNTDVLRLARHLDAEDKAAREAVFGHLPDLSCMAHDFARRHILLEIKPTVEQILNCCGFPLTPQNVAKVLRDAGRLKEAGDE